jgi:NADH dehydrogenase FAD-containing subunit
MTANTVIVGGGFVGLFTALHLRHRNYPYPVLLIDAQDRFVFKPLLYEYLTGEMAEDQVTPPYTELLADSDISFVQGNVTEIDLHQRQIVLASGEQHSYQALVLAVGSVQGYFDTQGAKEHAFPFRTRADVLTLKAHLQDCLQRASKTSDRVQRQSLLTFAVVGAGPSGIEIAATLADLLPDWYRQLGGDIQELQIVVMNHGKEILEGDINTNLREIATEALKNKIIPIALKLGTAVKSVTPDQLCYETQDQQTGNLQTATTIWTSGTATHPLIGSLALPADCLDHHGELLVTPTLQIPSFPEVFAAGDCATVQNQSLPQVAQIAYQQGAGIASNLVALAQGQPLQPIRATLRGTLMKLGIHNGTANLFDKVQINGQAGDLIRNATYLEMLPSPAHNFKAVTEWIKDEIFERHRSLPSDKDSTSSPLSSKPAPPKPGGVWLGAIVVIALLGVGFAFWRQLPLHAPQSPAPQSSPQ